MAHYSRIGVLVIDCQGENIADATEFWARALGVTGKVDADGKYAVLADCKGYPKVLLQSVSHAPRIHLDIETDNQQAEAARLQSIGAKLVERHPKGWLVMQAPSGHRFCLVNPQGDDFPGDARRWED